VFQTVGELEKHNFLDILFIIVHSLKTFLTDFIEIGHKTMANKFYYFGFGSNMLARRIHIQNPTARRIGAGKLQVIIKIS